MVKFRIIVEGVYSGASKEFDHGVLKGIARCLKANINDSSVLLRYENGNQTSQLDARWDVQNHKGKRRTGIAG